jgi:hypothetical protein
MNLFRAVVLRVRSGARHQERRCVIREAQILGGGGSGQRARASNTREPDELAASALSKQAERIPVIGAVAALPQSLIWLQSAVLEPMSCWLPVRVTAK